MNLASQTWDLKVASQSGKAFWTQPHAVSCIVHGKRFPTSKAELSTRPDISQDLLNHSACQLCQSSFSLRRDCRLMSENELIYGSSAIQSRTYSKELLPQQISPAHHAWMCFSELGTFEELQPGYLPPSPGCPLSVAVRSGSPCPPCSPSFIGWRSSYAANVATKSDCSFVVRSPIALVKGTLSGQPIA